MRVTVVGGIGYIGGRLAGFLTSAGHRVRVTTRRPAHTAPSWLAADEVVHASLADESELLAALSGSEVVVQLAAPDEIAAARDPVGALRAGGELTRNTLAALSKCSPRPVFLYISTFHVYGRNGHGDVHEGTVPLPSHPYGLARHAGENVTQVFRQREHLQALCIRLANVFGAPASIDIPRWSLVFNDLCLQAAVNKRLVLNTSGSQRRNFITLHDAVAAMEFLFLRPTQWPPDGIIHVGSSMTFSIREVAERVARLASEVLPVTPPIETAPNGSPGDEQPLNFSIERLSDMGFRWSNAVDSEIRNTLKLCQEAERRWGPALLQRCRPDLTGQR